MPIKGKKYKLEIDNNVFDNAVAFGIITSESELKFTAELNRYLAISLTLSTPINLFIKNKDYSFKLFRYDNFDLEQQYLLIKNKSDSQFFSKEYSHVDYILFILDDGKSTRVNEINEKIKQVERIQTIQLLDITKIKSRTSIPL